MYSLWPWIVLWAVPSGPCHVLTGLSTARPLGSAAGHGHQQKQLGSDCTVSLAGNHWPGKSQAQPDSRRGPDWPGAAGPQSHVAKGLGFKEGGNCSSFCKQSPAQGLLHLNSQSSPVGQRGKLRHRAVKFLVPTRNWQSWDMSPEPRLSLPIRWVWAVGWGTPVLGPSLTSQGLKSSSGPRNMAGGRSGWAPPPPSCPPAEEACGLHQRPSRPVLSCGAAGRRWPRPSPEPHPCGH